jgi:cobalt-zinc-cadmium efflux system membrane fusion protein
MMMVVYMLIMLPILQNRKSSTQLTQLSIIITTAPITNIHTTNLIMNRWGIILVAALSLTACQRSATNEEEHGHPHEPESVTLAYTLYSDKTELFVEFKPLIVGKSSRFAAHFTQLGESFKSLDEGKITLSLIIGDNGIRTIADKASSPGIFRLALSPKTSGRGKLVFDIETKGYTDRIEIDSIVVYADDKSAQAIPAEEGGSSDISFLKEQAWKIDFANHELKPEVFYDVIKVSGQINAKPTDEQVIAARSNGIVKWDESIVGGASVREGQNLLVLSSGNLAQGNTESAYREAKVNYEKAEADFKRIEPLRADKIISEKDYLQIKNTFDQAKIVFETLSKNYSQGGQSMRSPMSGFVKQVIARSGEFVEAGQPLAVITKNQMLQLQADVPLRYSNQLPLVLEAQFKTMHDDSVYNTRELNGKVLSYGKAVSDGSSLLPIYFSLKNNGQLTPGESIEVYLKSSAIQNAFVVPVSALVEEQGNFYVYVQTEGESFQKRNVTLGAQDGRRVQLLSGVAAGERIVTKGAYMIKLATQSGAVPAHGHEH